MCVGSNSDNWGVFPFSQITQETERWRAMHSPGVRVMRGMPFASVICDRRARPTSKVWQLTNWVGWPPVVTTISANLYHLAKTAQHDVNTAIRILRMRSHSDCIISAGMCLVQRRRIAGLRALMAWTSVRGIGAKGLGTGPSHDARRPGTPVRCPRLCARGDGAISV